MAQIEADATNGIDKVTQHCISQLFFSVPSLYSPTLCDSSFWPCGSVVKDESGFHETLNFRICIHEDGFKNVPVCLPLVR